MKRFFSYFGKFLDVVKNSKYVLRLFWVKNKKYILSLFLFSVVVSVFPFVHSGANGYLINKLIENIAKKSGLNTEISIAIAMALGVVFISPYFHTFYKYIQKILWFRVHEQTEFTIYKKLSRLGIKQRENPEVNDLINTIAENKWRVNNFLDRIFFIFQDIIAIVTALVIVFKFNWWASVLIIIGTFPEFVVGVKHAKFSWWIYDAKGEVKRKFWNLEGYLKNKDTAKEIKTFQSEKYFISKMKQLFKNFRKEEFKNEKRRVKYESVAIFMSQFSEILIFFLFIMDTLNGDMQVGTLAFVSGSVVKLRASLNSFFRNLGSQYQDMLFVNDIIKFLNLKDDEVDEPKTKIKSKQECPEIVFDNVSFKYPFTEKYALKNISFTINPGDKLAIVGENGAGKSTLIKLLCRFYKPTEGRILINGTDLNELDMESWYKLLSVVFQEYGTYKFKVKESIAVSKPYESIDIDKIKESASLAGADKFIKKFDNGYEQMLGIEFRDGIDLSTGQWQKIALSRVFYRDSFVFILDEPTSALDPISEEKVFDILREKTDEKIIIFISHRFSTIRQADRIIVLDGGRIVEAGNHNELMKNDKLYKKMFVSQSKGYR